MSLSNWKVMQNFVGGFAAKGGNVKTDGRALWSYNTIIALHLDDRPDGRYLLNKKNYSVTTKRHQHEVIRVIDIEDGEIYPCSEDEIYHAFANPAAPPVIVRYRSAESLQEALQDMKHVWRKKVGYTSFPWEKFHGIISDEMSFSIIRNVTNVSDMCLVLPCLRGPRLEDALAFVTRAYKKEKKGGEQPCTHCQVALREDYLRALNKCLRNVRKGGYTLTEGALKKIDAVLKKEEYQKSGEKGRGLLNYLGCIYSIAGGRVTYVTLFAGLDDRQLNERYLKRSYNRPFVRFWIPHLGRWYGLEEYYDQRHKNQNMAFVLSEGQGKQVRTTMTKTNYKLVSSLLAMYKLSIEG